MDKSESGAVDRERNRKTHHPARRLVVAPQDCFYAPCSSAVPHSGGPIRGTRRFQKKLRAAFEANQKEYPEKEVEIWSEDEARLGLQPIVRRVWFPKGERPVACQNRKYEWVYAYAFVHPATGKSFWLLLPSVNVTLMNLALKEFSSFIDPERKKRIILLVDGAGFHTGKAMDIPENMQFFPLPPYTPELQPTETVWPLLRESVANDPHADLGIFEEKLATRCEWLGQHPETVRGVAGFSWIREIECGTV